VFSLPYVKYDELHLATQADTDSKQTTIQYSKYNRIQAKESKNKTTNARIYKTKTFLLTYIVVSCTLLIASIVKTDAAAAAAVDAICQVWCRVLHVVTQYLVSCNFMWMFCEGFYLHTLIVRAFTTTNKLLVACYVIGWGRSASPHLTSTYLTLPYVFVC